MNNIITKITSIAAVFSILTAFIWGIFYPDYAAHSEKVTDIPGLSEGFVPQGSTYLDEEDTYLICGYMDDDTSSRIYAIKDGETRKIILQRQDGSVYAGHAGGITCAGDYIYISNAEKLFILKRSDVTSTQDGGTVAFTGSVPVPCRSSFCSCDGDTLYVGEYHADGYETDESHIIKTPDGSEYQALVFGYRITPDAEFGIDMSAPCAAWSVCDEVQGFAVLPGGRAVLSTSAGFKNSKLKVYDATGESEGEFDLDGVKVPLFYLDSGRFEKEMTIPRMSEDLECVNGKILVGFEAGAKKFAYGIVPFSEKKSVLVEL
ncbi:MAG: hypothetical protein IJM02_02515 [Clostridia bacterium]|nr:hypothetical protein [Clostridia bacterium]